MLLINKNDNQIKGIFTWSLSKSILHLIHSTLGLGCSFSCQLKWVFLWPLVTWRVRRWGRPNFAKANVKIVHAVKWPCSQNWRVRNTEIHQYSWNTTKLHRSMKWVFCCHIRCSLLAIQFPVDATTVLCRFMSAWYNLTFFSLIPTIHFRK